MPLKSNTPMTNLSSYCIAVLCLSLAACAGGYYTSKVNGEKKVYRVDEQGTKTLVYETDHERRRPCDIRLAARANIPRMSPASSTAVAPRFTPG